MTAYAAFLRGINVGGNKLISMAELRQATEELGYTDVASYLNSGNLVLVTPEPRSAVERALTTMITRRFGLSVDVAARSRIQLEQVLRDNPFPEGNPSQVTIAFLVGKPPPGAPDRIAAVAADHEPFVVAGREVYVHYTRGLGTSKLAEQFSRVVGVSATVRNLRTVGKVAELLGR